MKFVGIPKNKSPKSKTQTHCLYHKRQQNLNASERIVKSYLREVAANCQSCTVGSQSHQLVLKSAEDCHSDLYINVQSTQLINK